MSRLEIAAKILSGFAANSAIFAPNNQCGWSLVNCTDEHIAAYALHLADKLIEGEAVIAARKEAQPWGNDPIMRRHLSEGGTPA